MNTFAEFYKELCSDEIWFEHAGKNHKPETFQKVAEHVYALALSDRESFAICPMREHRNHVVNKLGKIQPDKISKPWYVLEAEKKSKLEYEQDEGKNWTPVTGEERMKRLKEWEAIVKGSTMVSALPRPSYKQLAEEGGILPPKPAPYPVTSAEEAYIKDRHIAYIEYAYEPKTGQKRPLVMSEDDFNLQYDAMMFK